MIKSSTVQDAVASRGQSLVFPSKTQLTIGASKLGDGEFLWDDGTPVIFQNFLYKIPADASTSYCAAVDGLAEFSWTPYRCQSTTLRGTLCEIGKLAVNFLSNTCD